MLLRDTEHIPDKFIVSVVKIGDRMLSWVQGTWADDYVFPEKS